MFSINKSDEQLDNLYMKINRYYLINPIDRETMQLIISRIAEIADLYYDIVIDDKLKIERFRKTYERECLCFRILNNKVCNEPSTINTILSFLTGVYHFVDWMYGIKTAKIPPIRLYNDYNFFSLNLFNIYEYNSAHRFEWIINDGTLPDMIKRFFEITDEELISGMREYKRLKH